VLVFTGKTDPSGEEYLSSSTHVLHRWAVRSPEMVHTRTKLIKGAKHAESARMKGDLEALGLCVTDYWRQKKRSV